MLDLPPGPQDASGKLAKEGDQRGWNLASPPGWTPEGCEGIHPGLVTRIPSPHFFFGIQESQPKTTNDPVKPGELGHVGAVTNFFRVDEFIGLLVSPKIATGILGMRSIVSLFPPRDGSSHSC